jgi:outer membrane protein assembly factor BamB
MRRRLQAGGVLLSAFVLSVGQSLLPADRAEAATSDQLRVLSARSGRQVWRATPERGAFYDVSAGAETVVAMSGTCLASGDGITKRRLAAFDAQSGKQRWDTEGSTLVGTVGGASMNRLGQDAVTVPVDASGVVVVIPNRSSPPHTNGLDARSGSVRWTMRDQAVTASRNLVFAPTSPPNPTPGQPAPGLNAFERTTGKLRWTFDIEDPQWTRSIQVVAADERVVVVVSGGFLERVNGVPASPIMFFVIDAQTGAELSRFDARDPAVQFSNLSITDGALVYAEGLSVLSRDLVTGTVRWRQPVDEKKFQKSNSNKPSVLLAVASDGATVFAYDENQAHPVIAFDARSGATRWSLSGLRFRSADAQSTVLSTPGEASRLVVYDTATGSPRWERKLALDGNVALGGNRVATTPACDMR